MNGPPLCISSVNQVCNENACKLNCKQWPAWVTCAGLPPRASALRRWQPPIRRRRRELPWTANHSTAATQSRLPPFLWLRAGQSVAVHTGVSSTAGWRVARWLGRGEGGFRCRRRRPPRASRGRQPPPLGRFLCRGEPARPTTAAQHTRRRAPPTSGPLACGCAPLFSIWQGGRRGNAVADVRVFATCVRDRLSPPSPGGGGDRGGELPR